MIFGAMNKCVFLDRDGVLNKDDPNYTFDVSKFKIIPGVPEAVGLLKEQGFLLIVVTNQSGISQGFYTIEQMNACHDYFQRQCGNAVDHFYFSPYHPTVTQSLLRKPDSLMFEKAIARYDIHASRSWMVGDRERDLIPAHKLGIRTIQVGDEFETAGHSDFKAVNLLEGARLILKQG